VAGKCEQIEAEQEQCRPLPRGRSYAALGNDDEGAR
jgi:hypothetical protein